MRPTVRAIAALSTALLLAACGGTATPTTAPAATSGPAATAAAAGPCKDSTDATVVAATVGDNTWSQPVNAKVNDVITWTNSDGVPHKVELDDSSCGMKDNIPGGGSKSLVFTKAGAYPFHCSVHQSMKGTITIS